MKIQINHYIPEENIVQQEVFEDVEKFSFQRSNIVNDDQIFLDIDFKYGSENYKKFKYHCCGEYVDFKLDTIRVRE